MSKNKFFLFIVFLIISLVTSSYGKDSPIDSLKQVWNDNSIADSTRFKAINDFAKAQMYSNPESILSVSDFHYDLAQSKGNSDELFKAYENKALALSTLGRFEMALSYSKKAIDLASELKDSTALARRYINRGNIFYHQSKFKEAIQHYLKSKTILEEQDAKAPLADLLNNMGLVYFSIGYHEFALKYLHEALVLYKGLGMQDAIGEIWTNIGVAYFEQDSFEESYENIQKALPILQAQNHIVGVEYCYYYLARYHHEVKQLDSAFIYINKSIDLNEKISNSSNMVRSKTLLGNLFLPKDVSKATQLGQEALVLSSDILNQSAKMDIYDLLYQCNKKQGKTKLALEMLENYITYRDSSLVQENQLTIVREELVSDYNQKLFETQFKNEQAKAILKLSHLKRIFALILGSLLLIGFIGFIARKRILEQHQQKEDLLAEIERLKQKNNSAVTLQAQKFQLVRSKIEASTNRKLNETDWNVLNILLDDPVISNKGIAEKAFLTVDGIGSSLRRMYVSFDIKQSKYKKISLLMEAIKISNN